MNAAAQSSTPARHPDGFGGARDERILMDYADKDTPVSGIVHVQAVARTKDLLHRAGFKRLRTHEHYPVKVTNSVPYRQLQLAPAESVEVTSFILVETIQERPMNFVEEMKAVSKAEDRRDPIFLELRRRLALVAQPQPGDIRIGCGWPRRLENLFTALWIYLRSPHAMNATAPNMKTATLTHAQQSAILGKSPWGPGKTIRITAAHRTEALLHLAGVPHPRPLEEYLVPVKHDDSGFLIVDRSRRVLSASDEDLTEPGGIFHGLALAAPDPSHSARAETPAVSKEDLAGLCEITRTRTFEISTGPGTKIRVQVVAFEDEALPAPLEPERWMPVKPTDGDVRHAIQELHVVRGLQSIEQL